MNDKESSLDLTPLDPGNDPDRLDRAVASIMASVDDQLSARRYRRNALGQVAGWWRPLLAAAAVMGIISVATLASIGARVQNTESDTGIAEAIGVPEQIAQWVRSDETPEPAELLLTLEDDR